MTRWSNPDSRNCKTSKQHRSRTLHVLRPSNSLKVFKPYTLSFTSQFRVLPVTVGPRLMGSCHCHITGYPANYPFLDQWDCIVHGKQLMVNDIVDSLTRLAHNLSLFMFKLNPHPSFQTVSGGWIGFCAVDVYKQAEACWDSFRNHRWYFY